MAALEALLDALGERARDVLLELGEVISVDLVGEAEGGVDDFGVDVDNEVLGDGAGTGVLRVETSNRNSGLAVQVLLEVDAALREDGALVLSQGGVEFGDEAVLENESREHFGVGDEGQEFSGAGMEVRGIQAAGVEEDAGSGDASACQKGEVGALSKIDLATGARSDGRVGSRVEVELQVDGATGELRLQFIEASNSVGRGQELGDQTVRSGRVDSHSWSTGGNRASGGSGLDSGSRGRGVRGLSLSDRSSGDSGGKGCDDECLGKHIDLSCG